MYVESVSAPTERQTHTARVRSVEDAGAGLVEVVLDVPPPCARAYVHVGQYVEVLAEDAVAYFALCNDPGEAPFRLLIRPRGTVAEALARAHAGAAFTVSEPLGSGFEWDKTRDADVFVVVAGTGFAIAPAILRARLSEGASASTFLLVGTAGEVPMAHALSGIRAAGVSVTLCVPLGHGREAVFPRVEADLETTLALRLSDLRSAGAESSRRRVCVFAAGPEALLSSLEALVRAENERARTTWCELLLNA